VAHKRKLTLTADLLRWNLIKKPTKMITFCSIVKRKKTVQVPQHHECGAILVKNKSQKYTKSVVPYNPTDLSKR
jgi:hypothetical protein